MKWFISVADGLNKLKDIPPLFFRLLLTWGFLGPFLSKWQDPSAFAGFLRSMNYPIPEVSAWVAMIVEGLGVIFLFFGFLTRVISIPLMFMLACAIFTVHISHGYAPGANGFAIPLVYFLMLFSLFITGPGKVSVDAILAGPVRRQSSK